MISRHAAARLRKALPARRTKAQYYKLEIVAASPATEIWLGDDAGHLVQKEVGKLKTSLLPGDYVVEFGLGTSPYAIHLDKALRYTQAELEAGPTCVRTCTCTAVTGRPSSGLSQR